MERKTKLAISKLRLPFFKRLKGRGTQASAVSDASSDAFILFDRNLDIVGMNPVMRSMFHLILGENVIGEDVPNGAPNMKPDSKNNGRYEKYLNAIRKGKPFFADSVVIHSEFIDVNLKAEAFKVGKGFGVIFSDLGTLRKTGETPYEAQKGLVTNLQSAADCIFIFDLKGTILHGSRAGERLTGYAWEEIKGRSLFEIPLFAPEYMPKVAQLLELSAAGEPTGPDEFELIGKDGSRVSVEISTCPIGRGEEVEVIAIAHDITERKQYEEALRQSEERYQAIVGTSLDGVYQVDTSGKLTFINESFAKTFGYKREELLGKHFSSLLSLGTFTKVKEMVGQVLAGENVRDEVPVQHKDGHEVLVNFGAALLKDRGKIIGLTGILRDVTKRKQMEEALANSEAKYRSLIETTSAGVAAIDLTGALVLVNEALCKMIGYSQEELLGRNFADFLHPDDKNEVLEIFAQGLIREREQPHLEFRVIHKDGHSVWCYSSPSPIVQGNEIAGFSAIIQDITERKQMEQALQDSEVEYRNLFNNAQVGLFRTRISDGKQLECNELLAKMVGYDTREECLAEFVTSEHYVDPNVREQMLKEIRKEGEVRNFEVQIRRRDNSPFWMSYSARIYPERGYIEGAVVDITERKRMEEALKAERQRLHDVLEAMPILVCLLTPDYHVAFANRAFREKFGEWRGRRCYEYCFGEKEPCDFCEAYRVLKTGKPHHWQVTTPDGAVIDAYDFPFTDVDGSHLILEMDIDIAERKKMEEELQEAEENFKALAENAIDGILVGSGEGNHVYVNKRAVEITGYSVVELLKTSIKDLAHPDELKKSMERYRKRLEGEPVSQRYETIIVRKDGKSVPVEIAGAKTVWKGKLADMVFVRDITERKKVDQALGQSEDRFLRVLDNAIDMIYWLNLKTGEYDYVAPSSEKVIGYTPDELIALGIAGGRSLAHPDDSERLDQNVIDLVMNAGNGNAPSAIEYRFAHKKLGYRWMFDNRSIVYDGDEPVAIVGSLRDITERKLAEEELWSARERLQRMFDSVKDGVCVTDLDGTITDVNPKGLEVYRASTKAEVIGKSALELIAPHEREKAVAEMQRVLEQGTAGLIEHNVVRADGSGFLAELNVSLLKEISGNATGFIAVLRDITERKQMEGRLEFLSNIIDQANDAVTVTNLSYEITYINDAAQRMFGYSLEELVGKSPGIFNTEPNAEGMQNEIYQAVSSGKTFLGPALNKRKDGSTFVCEFKVFPLYEHGDIVAYAAFQRDITERKLAEEALEESESKFRSVLEHSVGVIYQLNLKTATYDYVSPSSIEALGYSPEELIALGFEKATSVIHPDDVERVREHFSKLTKRTAADDTEPPTIEYRVKHRELGYRWMGDTSSVLCDDNNVPIAITGNVRDITKRKNAEEELKDSEERYRALVDTAGLAGEGIMIVERAEGDKAVIAFVNNTLAGVLGYQQEGMLGMPARDLFLPGDRIWLRDSHRRRRKGEALPSHYGVMALRKDGSMLPIEISMGAMRYQGKSATVVYVRDVTERKKAEESLRESEAQFRAIFDRAAIGVGLLDVNGQPFRINPALREMLGYTIEELHSKALSEYMHPDDAKLDLKLFREMVAGKRDHYQVEKRFIRKDGRIVWGRVTLSAVRNLVGKFQFAISMLEDITDSKLALENVKKSEERFRSLIENASEVVLIIDKEGAITYASPAVERVLGYTIEEGIDTMGFSYIHPDDMPEVIKLFDQALQNPGKTLIAKVRARHKDGSWLIVEAIGRNLLDDPTVGGIVVNYRDVTERERAHEELLRHTKLVEALHAIAQTVSQTLELEELLDRSLDKVIEVMEAEAGCVYLLDMVEKELVLRTSRGLSDETISRLATIKLNENNVQKIKEWKGGSTPLRKVFEESGLGITAEVKEKEQIQSFAVAPFAVRGQLSGLIAVGNRAHRKFSPGDIDLLRAVGNQIGIGTQNAMLYEEVRALIRETIDAQEKERERICLEVHDGVAQTLVCAFQYLQALEVTVPDDTKTKQLLAKTSAQVKQAIQESREIINSLQPATLSDLGLVSTLRQELKRLAQETGLKIDFKADAIRLSKDIETGLYRIIHEAVFNARKHANTRRLRVKINSEDERVKVEVRDWGKGFDKAYLDRASKRGTGLFSIRKRAELMKGACEIESEPGEGTTVRVEIPVRAAERSSG